MNFFVTGVGGQLGHDVMNELLKRGHEGVGSDIQETYSGVADGSAVTKAPYAASTKPVNSRKGFYLDDIVGTFGVPVEEHRKESEVKQMDGYVSMGILTGKIAPEAGKD